MRSYMIEIVGQTPLLQHHDDIDWSDEMNAWKEKNSKAGNNKEVSKAGDDRTPAHRWIGCLYKGPMKSGGKDETVVVMPTDNIMRAIMGGAATVLIPGGRNGKTFKAESQSGIIPDSVGWPLLIDGDPIPYAPIAELLKVKDFAKHKERVRQLGFELFMKRAKVGSSKHVRVRPRFDMWSIKGVLRVSNDLITDEVLSAFLERAGSDKGLGDWRPGAPKSPGSYGMFTATVERIN
jgi:hypothetical protein